MLNFDNTVNYAPSFKKIDESIESINTLLTSLLLDTYTNQTFIYSDINVIRVNTSQNYDSIQSLSSSLPYKFNASDSTNFFLKSNSLQLASTSTLSDKFNVSDSTNFFLKSNSVIFASTSTLSDKFNASDSTQFALQSDFEQQISEKLNITDFSLYSLDFASTSQLSSKFNASDSTLFALSSELSSKLNLSDSTYFLPSSDYSTQSVQVNYLSKLTDLINTNFSYIIFSVDGNVYNLDRTTVSNMGMTIQNNLLLNRFYMWSDTLSFVSDTIIGGYGIKNNVFSINRGNSIIGTFFSNTFHDGYRNTVLGDFANNLFSSQTNLEIKVDDVTFNHNTLSDCRSVIIDCSRSNNIKNRNMYSNSFDDVISMKIKNADLSSNIFYYPRCCTFYNVGLYSNKFSMVPYTPLHIKMNEYYSNSYLISANTFAFCNSITFDIHNYDNNWTTQTNVFSRVDYVELNIDSDMDIDLRKFFGLSSSCSIGGININIHPNDYKKRVFEEQIGNLTTSINILARATNLMYLSFNSTNDWINSGFRKTLSSWCGTPGIFWNYSLNSKLNVQGSIISSTGKISDLKDKYFQPKFSPNYNSLKHYMVLYGDSYRDYFELDPHALEAGHNNNACENILLQKDYTFYSTLQTAEGKDNYTFIQWPSTEITFPKSDYSNNTLLNTISDITTHMGNYGHTALHYRFGTNDITHTSVYYSLYSGLAANLASTLSSSQLYAGFSCSGLLTSTETYQTSIQY